MSTEKHSRTHPLTQQRARQLRKEQTPAEQKLWRALRSRNLEGFKFRRQHPIDRFIVDFYCAEVRLVIEVDGDVHAAQEEYDATRTEWLQTAGCTVMRFQNRDVLQRLDDVAQEIIEMCQVLKRPASL